MPSQVPPQHYSFESYVTPARWNSYWHQIREVVAAKPDDVLYIGIGDDIVPKVLEARGIRVKRFDFDPSLGCDFTGDVREIASIVPVGSADVVVCCQVLEHLPYEDFEETLKGIFRIARKRVVLSLPYAHVTLAGLRMKLPKTPRISLNLTLPCFWQDWKFDGQHYWEIGTKFYSRRRIENSISRVGRIAYQFFASDNKYHLFYILEK
ncbi:MULTISPECIES: class I SAM-dependent methyltransferase [Methylocaldum]|jgi:hypothetical protein|uniref:class I SAM-dependent methyltransferase n=1 Tax=Methylocaldum sp. RMAD-M TaxID=2806557 RepID=UPI000A323979|nr:methyltransferase domain-containing protein [Methylocaldum sp. RMAD-M]MBP1149039.1 hypothetical protein [Methylocaldum sp. RMAD-M]MVF20235.1 class I SAM-dependent methyltransferase [Methylocaldum sp. BRCS4]